MDLGGKNITQLKQIAKDLKIPYASYTKDTKGALAEAIRRHLMMPEGGYITPAGIVPEEIEDEPIDARPAQEEPVPPVPVLEMAGLEPPRADSVTARRVQPPVPVLEMAGLEPPRAPAPGLYPRVPTPSSKGYGARTAILPENVRCLGLIF